MVTTNSTEHRLTVSNLFLLTAIVAALAVSLDAGSLAAQLGEAASARATVLVPISLVILIVSGFGALIGCLRCRTWFAALIGAGAGWAAGLYLIALLTAPASSERIASGVMIACLAPLIVRATHD